MKENELKSFVMQFALFARDGIFEARTVSRVNHALAQASKPGFTGHEEQRGVKVRMIFT